MEKHTKSQNSITISQLLLQTCLHAETPNVVKHKLILGPKFDTLWENHTSSWYRCVYMQTLHSDAEIDMT
jgi:hypothetical protein